MQYEHKGGREGGREGGSLSMNKQQVQYIQKQE